MPPAESERLRHMCDLAIEAITLAGSKTLDDVRGDRVLSLALIHLVELIGEAASHVSESGRASLGSVPGFRSSPRGTVSSTGIIRPRSRSFTRWSRMIFLRSWSRCIAIAAERWTPTLPFSAS